MATALRKNVDAPTVSHSFLNQKAVIGSMQKSAPIHVVPIADALGIPVSKVSNWNDDLSGMIRKEDTASGFAIYVNAGHSAVRRRFTIAHEIAHAVLHPNLIGDGIVDDALYRSGLSSAVEAQANRFAADILMPWHLLNEFLERGINQMDELAAQFWVSSQAMAIRIGAPQN